MQKLKFLCATFVLFLFLCTGIGWGLFFHRNSGYRAEKYLELSLQEYRKAIKADPSDSALVKKYRRILEAAIGKIPSMVEMTLLYREIGLESPDNKILFKLTVSDKSKSLSYLKEKIEKAEKPKEVVEMYSVATLLSPEDGKMWYQLGKIHLGLNNINEGISSLEKAYGYGVNEKDLFYYLSNAYRYTKNYEKATFFALKGAEILEKKDVSFHKLLYGIFKEQKKEGLAKEEKEKIKTLLVKKKIVVKKVEKIVKAEKISGISSYVFLGVSKKDQLLYVHRFNGSKFDIIGRYPCGTGKNYGSKEKEGDGKTPEGTYLLTSKLDSSSRLPPKYGIAAFPLNYLGILDKRLKKDGDGIWLHGTSIERPPYNSDGCIVLTDKHLIEIMKYISPGRTFIYISKTPERFRVSFVKEVKDVVEKWRKGWESLNLDTYLSSYDEKFYSRGKNKKQWASYKKNINRNKKFIKVELSNIQIIPYGKTELGEISIVWFRQKYSSSDFKSSVNKILYLVRRDRSWKIIAEGQFEM